MKCEDCKWWQREWAKDSDEDNEGDCRKYAPRLVKGMMKCYDEGDVNNQELCGKPMSVENIWNYRHAMWPMTMGDNWCGEYEKKEEGA